MTTTQFRAINGFSNEFWGWGGEDDDLFKRVRHEGLTISRYPPEVGRYTMFSHKKAEPNPTRLDSHQMQFCGGLTEAEDGQQLFGVKKKKKKII